MEYHPAAKEFPMMDPNRFRELKGDIETNGQRVAITICDGKILDGRNRYKACQELKLEPLTETYSGNPWAYVWSLNAQRRDLVAEQRYLIWKHISEHSEAWQAEQQRIKDEANRKRSEATEKRPRNPDGTLADKPVAEHYVPPLALDRHPNRKVKAEASHTSTGTVMRGDQLAKARPDLAQKVRQGTIKPTEAHRQMKKDSVIDRVKALPDGKYRVFYADPPWAYSDKQGGTISSSYGAAEKHYPSMTLSELEAMPIRDMANDDAVLFLWVTSPLLPSGLAVATAWGFKYKACFVWDKILHNMGHYNSVRHEFLLICTRGSCVPDIVKLFDSVVSIERTPKHSEKPEKFREIIDTLYLHGKRVELFARNSVEGWEQWGNET